MARFWVQDSVKLRSVCGQSDFPKGFVGTVVVLHNDPQSISRFPAATRPLTNPFPSPHLTSLPPVSVPSPACCCYFCVLFRSHLYTTLCISVCPTLPPRLGEQIRNAEFTTMLYLVNVLNTDYFIL